MLRYLRTRSDLLVVAVLVAAVLLMILPLPTTLVDVLLACNMGISVVLLMTAFYLHKPVEFSTLPSVVLIATVFRLSLSIAVTRLVLLQADAGEIVRAFGEFVVGGNLVVGLVVFLIITVVQFVVITKGSERVAEVAARFTLDSLPGKQMAIDADVRAGEIDQAEARRQRAALERESQLYGAMDGAMKFVKGDAIAGLVIIVVNLLGGMAVGALQNGMSLSEAAHTYSILTVGDGLVAQIPALFVAITAGTVVTRVGGGAADSLGGEIAHQLSVDPRALSLAAVVIAVMGFIPGFPTLIFLGIAGVIGLLARLAARRRAEAIPETAQPAAPVAVAPPAPLLPGRVQLLLSPALADAMDAEPPDGTTLAHRLVAGTAALSEEIGVDIPPATIRTATALEGERFRLDIDAVPVIEGTIPARSLLVHDDAENALLADVAVAEGATLPGRQITLWARAEDHAALQSAGVGHMDAAGALAETVVLTLRRHAAQFIGIQETRQILARMEGEWEELVREAMRIAPLQRIAELLRHLLDEGISLRNMRGILEALVEYGGREQDFSLRIESIRGALRRQICHAHADENRIIATFMIDTEAEVAIRGAIRQTPSGTYLGLQEGSALALVERIRVETATIRRPPPVLLCAIDIRRQLRTLLINNGVDIPVLSFHDLLPEFTVQPLGMIRVGSDDPHRDPEAAYGMHAAGGAA
jgi:type III secretion protein V